MAVTALTMKFEPEEPTHRAFSTHSESLEDLVAMNPLVAAYAQRCGVHEIHTRTLAKQNLFDKHHQWEGHLFF